MPSLHAVRLAKPCHILKGESPVPIGATVYRALDLLVRANGRAPVARVCRVVWGYRRCMNTVYSLCERTNRTLRAVGVPLCCGVDDGAVVLC